MMVTIIHLSVAPLVGPPILHKPSYWVKFLVPCKLFIQLTLLKVLTTELSLYYWVGLLLPSQFPTLFLREGLIEGFPIKWQWSDRRGRLVVPSHIPRGAPSHVQKARERFLNVHGARLFNLLPKRLRNENSGDFPLFKNHLDIFLAQIPDQPTTTGLVRAAITNSLIDQVPMVPDLDLN